jgi:hypothetical protein
VKVGGLSVFFTCLAMPLLHLVMEEYPQGRLIALNHALIEMSRLGFYTGFTNDAVAVVCTGFSASNGGECVSNPFQVLQPTTISLK